MEQKEWDMQSLINALLKSIREYGIKEVSMGQYETVCRKIAHFAAERGFDRYYQGLRTDYDTFIDSQLNLNYSRRCRE